MSRFKRNLESIYRVVVASLFVSLLILITFSLRLYLIYPKCGRIKSSQTDSVLLHLAENEFYDLLILGGSEAFIFPAVLMKVLLEGPWDW